MHFVRVREFHTRPHLREISWGPPLSSEDVGRFQPFRLAWFGDQQQAAKS